MSNGATVTVFDSTYIFVTALMVHVGVDPDEGGVPRRSRLLSLAQINEVRTLPRQEAA